MNPSFLFNDAQPRPSILPMDLHGNLIYFRQQSTCKHFLVRTASCNFPVANKEDMCDCISYFLNMMGHIQQMAGFPCDMFGDIQNILTCQDIESRTGFVKYEQF